MAIIRAHITWDDAEEQLFEGEPLDLSTIPQESPLKTYVQPVNDTAVEEAPAEEAAPEAAPVEEAPAEPAPAEEVPAEDAAPAEDAPAA